MTSEFVRYFTTTLLFGLVFTICVDIKPILAQEADEVLNVIPEGDEDHPEFPSSGTPTNPTNPTESSISVTEINTDSSIITEPPSTSSSGTPTNPTNPTESSISVTEINTENSIITEQPSTFISSSEDSKPEIKTTSKPQDKPTLNCTDFKVEIDEDSDKSFIGQVVTSILKIPQVLWQTFTGLFN